MKVIPNNVLFKNIEQLLNEGKSVELRCFGRSMQPYLRGEGEEVIIASPFSEDELIPGAIVLFRHHSHLICHRIIHRNGENLIIKGDGVIKKQEKALVSDVIGIIRTVIRDNENPVSTQSKAAKLYWRCWNRLSPVRKYLLYIFRLWHKIFLSLRQN